MANKRIDEATSTETVGHEWDGIEELNTPLPRWWLWTFYLTIVFAIGYVIVYPAIPLLDKGTEGMWNWSSRGQLADEIKAEQEGKAALLASIAEAPLDQLPPDDELVRMAIAGGKAAFKVNCVQCHGAEGGGNPGYPNLADDDWLWGGDMMAIQTTITHGIRHPGDDATRYSMMPAFGRDGLLTATEINDVVSFVLTLSGKEKTGPASARGATVFANNCVTCHGPEGVGMREFGAPNLADAIALYGGDRAALAAQVNAPRHGVMPAWGDRLDPVTIKMLAAYVHSLGGGEDFVEVAETPAEEGNEQP